MLQDDISIVRFIEGAQVPGADPMFDAMYRDRKRVFVDLRGWDVPVIDGQFEMDQFDGPLTLYCIATNARGAHLGSIRLLNSEGPHLLGDIFPDLCEGGVPRGPDIWELTRGVLSPALSAQERRQVRNTVVTAVVEYALHRRIKAYTCIADSGWLSQILSLGWNCRPLGLPRKLQNTLTGALQIEITPETLDLLRETGTYVSSRLIVLNDSDRAHC
jgi:N-acyl-L-homoserine lactone synthetase